MVYTKVVKIEILLHVEREEQNQNS